jgi:hypothetical protein
MKPKTKEIRDPYDSTNRRLDALIRITAETLCRNNNERMEEADIIRILNSAGLTPSEIAKIMGRSGRGSVSSALYASDRR